LVGLKEFKRTPAGAAAAQLEVNPHTRAGQSHTTDGNDRSVVRYTNTT
jgi:hypothetical protein